MLRRRPGHSTEGLLAVGDSVLPCAIGRSGITALKREGDGATPRARLDLVAVLWRGDRLGRLRTALPSRAIRATDGWCDAPRHGRYNRFVRTPFAPSHEDLARADGLYDVVVVLNWNLRPRIDRAGSAIFLHVAGRKAEDCAGHKNAESKNTECKNTERMVGEGKAGLFAPTAGCIALPRATLVRLLARLPRRTTIVVA